MAWAGLTAFTGPPPVLPEGNHSSCRLLLCKPEVQRSDSQVATADSGWIWAYPPGKGLVGPDQIRLATDPPCPLCLTSGTPGKVSSSVQGGPGNPQGIRGQDLCRSRCGTKVPQSPFNSICFPRQGGEGTLASAG